MTAWFFNLTDDGSRIILRKRAEGDDTIGDAVQAFEPGESAYGLTFEELAKAEGGTIEVDDDTRQGRIVEQAGAEQP